MRMVRLRGIYPGAPDLDQPPSFANRISPAYISVTVAQKAPT
jgi:hypothetical protein